MSIKNRDNVIFEETSTLESGRRTNVSLAGYCPSCMRHQLFRLAQCRAGVGRVLVPLLEFLAVYGPPCIVTMHTDTFLSFLFPFITVCTAVLQLGVHVSDDEYIIQKAEG
ncbi:hypothetical protein BDR03DRAFT_948170 [Suillus americanus]|nr:hypothetical protein BDR03DRAFT_948170 [Suillus americanus]